MYCDDYNNIRTNILLQFYFSHEIVNDDIFIALQSTTDAETGAKHIPQTMSEFTRITSLSESDIVEAVESVSMSMLRHNYTLVTVFTSTAKFRKALSREFDIKIAEDRIIDVLIDSYLQRDIRNNEIPSSDASQLNALGWTYDRFKLIIGGVGLNKEEANANILKRIQNLRISIAPDEAIPEKKRDKYKLPLIEFLELSNRFDAACGTIGVRIFKRLLDVLIVLEYNNANRDAGRDYINLETVEYNHRSRIEIKECRYKSPYGLEKGFTKQDIVYSYDSNLNSTEGNQGAGLKIQAYFLIVNRILTMRYSTLMDFVTDISSFSNDIVQSYFRQEAGTADSLTHITGGASIKPIPSSMAEELDNLSLDRFVLTSFKRNKESKTYEQVNCLLTNDGLDILIDLANAPDVLERIADGLHDNGKSWYDLVTLREEFDNTAAHLSAVDNTIIQQYRELRDIKDPDSNYIHFKQEKQDRLKQIPSSQVLVVEALCDFLDNPSIDTFKTLTGETNTTLKEYEPSDIVQTLTQIYYEQFQVNLMENVDLLREIVERIKIYLELYNQPRYASYNRLFQIAYDAATQKLNEHIAKLNLILPMGNVLCTRISSVSINAMKEALGCCKEKFQCLLDNSRYFGAAFVPDTLNDELEEVIVRDNIAKAIKLRQAYKPKEVIKEDTRYLLGADTFYRSKGTGKLIISRLSEDTVSVLNSVLGDVEFRKENGVWREKRLSLQELQSFTSGIQMDVF